MTRTQIEALRAAVEARGDSGRTHWHGCEIDPMHRDCAVRRLLDAWDTAHQEIARLRDQESKAWAENRRASDQAIDALKGENTRLRTAMMELNALIADLQTTTHKEPHAGTHD